MSNPENDAPLSGMLDHWKTLKSQAESGELRMDEQVGSALKAQADQLITRLDLMLVRANQLQHVTGFGTLASAVALQKKFSEKALGADDSAVKRLQESIDIVRLMRDTYELAIRKIGETDQSIATDLGNAGAQ